MDEGQKAAPTAQLIESWFRRLETVVCNVDKKLDRLSDKVDYLTSEITNMKTSIHNVDTSKQMNQSHANKSHYTDEEATNIESNERLRQASSESSGSGYIMVRNKTDEFIENHARSRQSSADSCDSGYIIVRDRNTTAEPAPLPPIDGSDMHAPKTSHCILHEKVDIPAINEQNVICCSDSSDSGYMYMSGGNTNTTHKHLTDFNDTEDTEQLQADNKSEAPTKDHDDEDTSTNGEETQTDTEVSTGAFVDPSMENVSQMDIDICETNDPVTPTTLIGGDTNAAATLVQSDDQHSEDTVEVQQDTCTPSSDYVTVDYVETKVYPTEATLHMKSQTSDQINITCGVKRPTKCESDSTKPQHKSGYQIVEEGVSSVEITSLAETDHVGNGNDPISSDSSVSLSLVNTNRAHIGNEWNDKDVLDRATEEPIGDETSGEDSEGVSYNVDDDNLEVNADEQKDEVSTSNAPRFDDAGDSGGSDNGGYNGTLDARMVDVPSAANPSAAMMTTQNFVTESPNADAKVYKLSGTYDGERYKTEFPPERLKRQKTDQLDDNRSIYLSMEMDDGNGIGGKTTAHVDDNPPPPVDKTEDGMKLRAETQRMETQGMDTVYLRDDFSFIPPSSFGSGNHSIGSGGNDNSTNMASSNVGESLESMISNAFHDAQSMRESTLNTDMVSFPFGARVALSESPSGDEGRRHMLGTVISDGRKGTVKVLWDDGVEDRYENGAPGTTVVTQVDAPQPLIDRNSICFGSKVVRGPHWKWGEQDGGSGNVGIICKLEEKPKGTIAHLCKAIYHYSAQWVYERTPCDWAPYSDDSSRTIEAAYQGTKDALRVTTNNAKYIHEVDVNTMLARDVNNISLIYRIKRIGNEL